MNDQHLLIITFLLSLLALGIFFKSFKKDKTNLYNGLIFNIFVVVFSISIVIGGTLYNNPVLKTLYGLILIFYIFIGFFGVTILITGLFVNAHFVLKKERKTLSNLLTLILGTGLFLYLIISGFSEIINSPIFRYLIIYFGIIIMYFGLSFYNFLLVSIFNGFHKPKLNKDYIIVLGSGLINGHKVSKLLAARIDKAIEFYQLQRNNNQKSKIIFSGGQGKNETIPEGEAMAKYALDKGVLKEDVIIENKSRTTLENFKYSKLIMEESGKPYKAIFSTSNYHVLRANIYAKMVGLNISGIGGKTALYFLPNAAIREYIAIVAMKKKSYIIRILLITFIYIILSAAEYFLKGYVLN